MSNIGAFSALGLGKETTWGTGVAATAWFPFSGEGFRDGPEPISELQMRGILDRNPTYKGMQVVEGSFDGIAFPVELGHLLRAALGAPVTTGAGPYEHAFTPAQAAFSDDAALPPYSVSMIRGPQVIRYTGCVLSNLGLSFAQGGLLTYTTSWLGRDAAALTPTPTPVLPTANPFSVTAAITRDGTAFASITDFELSIANGLEAVRLINNTSLVGRIAWGGRREISFSGNADFVNTDLYDQFKTFGQEPWTITFTSGTNVLEIELPALLISSAGATVGGDGRISLAFEGQGEYDTATSRAMLVTLTNSQATY